MNYQTLRKAAILIDSLDGPTADALLDQMSPDQAARVRSAVMELGLVPQDEQEEVISEFFGTGNSRSPSGGGVELDSGLVQKLGNQHAAPRKTAAGDEAVRRDVPFKSLHDVEFHLLAPILQKEHPQTIAVIAAHLPPVRAAELLGALSAELQVDIIRRLSDLDETDPEILKEIEQSLEKWVSQQQQQRQRKKAGMKTVAAILEAARLQSNGAILTKLSGHKPQSKPVTAPVAIESEQPRSTLAFRFEDLIQVSDAALLALFRAADSELLTLALAGATPSLVERITKNLPSLLAKQLRQALTQLNTVRLSDIEYAQDQLAALAEQLERMGQIEALPKRPMELAS